MIAVKNLSFSFSEKFSLKNISFNLQKGEVLGLIGESGSGKSTLLNIINGFLEQETGEMFLEGKKLILPSQKLVPGNEKIKMVTQKNTLFPNISIAENVLYELRFFKKTYQSRRLKKLLNMLKISHISEKLPKELSGGELQRVLIAKAIADEPKVLLLDEPFSNLDSIIKKKITADLKQIIIKENMASVFVSHEITEAYGFANGIIILKNGRIIQKGSSEDIYFSPKNKYVAQLSGEGFIIDPKSLNLEHKRQIFIRPSNILLNEKGIFISKIIKSVFRGAFYEIHFLFDAKTIYIKSTILYPSGKEIRFDIVGPYIFI